MDWLQVHLALNHLPVIGIPLLVLFLLVARIRRSEEVTRFVLWALALLTGAAIAIKFTGDFAAEQSQARLAGAQTFVSRHEQAGDQATTAVFVLGLAVALALYLTRARRIMPGWLAILVITIGIATCAMLARSAHTGGQISHPELRSDNPR